MKLRIMIKKILSLIEELNEESEYLTDDPDIAAKIIDVINQVMFELCRMKKLPCYLEMQVTAGQTVRFQDIAAASGFDVYQIDIIRGVAYDSRAAGTVFKFTESGLAEIDFFRFPERITEENQDAYEFNLSDDVLEIMPYGVAADLLKSDVSTGYGSVYAARYDAMKQLLDPRYSMASISL